MVTAFLLALALAAEPGAFSRVEVEAVLGAPVDTFDPVATLGLPYAPGTVAVSYVVAERPTFAQVAGKAPRGLLTTVLYSADGRLVAARQQRLGELDAPVAEVTESLRTVLRRRRT